VHQDDPRASWRATLHWKGMVSRAVRGRHSALSHLPDPEVAEEMAALQRVRVEIAGPVLAPSDVADLDQRQARIRELTADKERLERELSVVSRAFGASLAIRDVKAEAVCEALPEDSVMVDYLLYRHDEEPRYLAFVVHGHDCSVERVELGPAEPIDQVIGRHRELLASPDELTRRVDRSGVEVRARVWDPVVDHLDGRHVLIAPDAALTGVSFVTLPLDDGRYLLETDRVFGYLDSAADLLRWVEPPQVEASGALLVGAVDFDLPSARPTPWRSTCLAERFEPLLETRREVEVLAARLRRKRPRESIHMVQGTSATVSAVAGAATGRRLIHLATHGFFATGRCRSILEPDQLGAGLNPMALSGVVLAGANTPRGEDDGIWSAQEVAGMDLEGTELVVLSACSTGLGEVRSGEGVLGLRRAFAAAGARTLVMSLWQIPDAETAVVMDTLYARTLRRRAWTVMDALREGQLEVLRANRELGEARPGSWGAFIAAGEWR